MKTFLEFMIENARIYPDMPPKKQFGDDTKMKLLSKGIIPPEENPNRPVDTTGANSPFADPEVKSYKVTTDKPMIGKDDAVKRALAAKGYDETGKKMQKATRAFPDVAPTKEFGQDTKMRLLKINRNIDANIEKTNNQKSKASINDTGIKKPTAKFIPKPQLASAENQKSTSKVNAKPPIPKARPANLAPKKQTFKQAFAAAPEGSKFTWNGETYLRKTKK
jgi:hypothetical protein